MNSPLSSSFPEIRAGTGVEVNVDEAVAVGIEVLLLVWVGLGVSCCVAVRVAVSLLGWLGVGESIGVDVINGRGVALGCRVALGFCISVDVEDKLLVVVLRPVIRMLSVAVVVGDGVNSANVVDGIVS
jgi:hypothetical protein